MTAGQHPRSPRSGRSERGQISVLIIGLTVIAALLAGTVANASNIFLQRRSLVSWADGAVTAAAQEVAVADLYGGSPWSTLPVSEPAARQAVADYVTRHGITGRFREFQIDDVTIDTGTGRVSVSLAASVPVLGAGGHASVAVSATAHALVPLD